jgi:hypothetical protein
MSRKQRTATTDLDKVAVGHADPGGDGSVSVLFRDGAAVMLPTAMRSLSGPALEVVEDLQATVRRIAEDQERVDVLVGAGRSLGLSWGSLGWCMGISAAGVRQRFGAPPAPKAEAPSRGRK